jgi:hypothetical protein
MGATTHQHDGGQFYTVAVGLVGLLAVPELAQVAAAGREGS